ncbi:SEC-C metal-binding domain-containing protein [Psychrobacillus sp.]|uniref:SEC-C metal-binding domain-containing protein n=1 Tax=Psychrobacillus sp. TaxID=1871623 RepID=UPI0028BE05C2|nr:SEC-C metal-binding domain-containing protein [Psychrobacillus sp.]
MIGRNDPCTCGSGKKYKACCLSKEKVVSIDEQVNEELHNIMYQFFTSHPSPKEQMEIYKWLGEREAILAEHYENEKASAIMGDSYYFSYRVDIWNDFLIKAANKTARPRVKAILEEWKNPKVLLARVDKVQDNRAVLKDVFTNEKAEIEIQQSFTAAKGDFVFGHVLQDNRVSDSFYIVLNSLVTLPVKDEHLIQEVKELFARSTCDSLEEFYNKYIIECFIMLGYKENNITDMFNEEEIKLIDELHSCLVEMDIKSDALMSLFIQFIQQKGIPKNIKKPLAIVAGAVQVGMLYEFIPNVWTKKQIAQFFDVSSSTANKYEMQIEDFYGTEVSIEELHDKTVFAFEVGTDASSAEYTNWELAMHMDTVSIKSEKEMSRYIEIFKNKEYEPKNKQEESQKYAYEAYTSKHGVYRQTSAKLANLYDPTNVDALLLMADYPEEGTPSELYEKAIEIGKNKFDSTFDSAWGYVPNRPYLRALFKYGLWQFSERNFKEAFKLFNELLQLNAGDNLGVRYPTVAALIALNRMEEAESLMDHYKESDNAFFSWFRWAIERKRNFFGQTTQEFFDLAKEDNAFVAKYYRDKVEPLPYPGKIAITPDSPEEGKVIWTLLHAIIK